MKNKISFILCLWFLVTGFWLLALSGCVSTPSRRSDPTQVPSLEPAAMLKMQDVPVPAGFVFVPEESYAFQSTNFRAGLLRYKGKGGGDQVIVFFKEQMPMYGWNLVNIVEYERRLLSFEKDQETCIITVEGKDNRSVITVSIAPKSQASPRKTDKPIK